MSLSFHGFESVFILSSIATLPCSLAPPLWDLLSQNFWEFPAVDQYRLKSSFQSFINIWRGLFVFDWSVKRLDSCQGNFWLQSVPVIHWARYFFPLQKIADTSWSCFSFLNFCWLLLWAALRFIWEHFDDCVPTDLDGQPFSFWIVQAGVLILHFRFQAFWWKLQIWSYCPAYS